MRVAHSAYMCSRNRVSLLLKIRLVYTPKKPYLCCKQGFFAMQSRLV